MLILWLGRLPWEEKSVSPVVHPPTDTHRAFRRAPRTFTSLLLSALLAVGSLYVAAPRAAAATVVRVPRPAGVTALSLTVGPDRVVGIDDRRGVGTTIPSTTTQLSGPYMISGETVKRTDGSLADFGVTVPGTTALFGPRTDNVIMELPTSIYVARRMFETGALATFSVRTDQASCTLGDRWADAVLLSCPNHTFAVADLTPTSVPGDPAVVLDAVAVAGGLGDGYALFKRPTGSTPYTLWNYNAKTLTDLPDCVTDPATDHVGHLACTSATDIVWMDFSSVSTSAPRMLGYLNPEWLDVAATPTWTLAADTTKALAAGAVDIMTPDGSTVVRTLPTPASADGSLRVSWDGRDSNGTLVAPGRYVVRLHVQAADGSGPVRSIDGTGSPDTYITVVAPGWSSFIRATYQDFFFSSSDTEDISGWSNYLAKYGHVASYLGGMAYGTMWLNAIVTKMHADTLGRTPDPGGLQFWINHTNDPSWGRDKVAYNFYQSVESRMDRVQAMYQVLLNREPDSVGWPFWTQRLLTTGDIALACDIANSTEYWDKAPTRF